MRKKKKRSSAKNLKAINRPHWLWSWNSWILVSICAPNFLQSHQSFFKNGYLGVATAVLKNYCLCKTQYCTTTLGAPKKANNLAIFCHLHASEAWELFYEISNFVNMQSQVGLPLVYHQPNSGKSSSSGYLSSGQYNLRSGMLYQQNGSSTTASHSSVKRGYGLAKSGANFQIGASATSYHASIQREYENFR